MIYFSLPADFKKETIDNYHRLNQEYKDSRILETYGNITIGYFMQSGRSIESLPRVDLKGLKEYIRYSKERDIGFNYTFNASFMQNREFTEQGILEILNFLGKLYDAGVRSLTISLPSLIDLVKSVSYEFEIVASTICQITNVSKALSYKRMGIERIVCDESINRNFDTLSRIRKNFGDKVELIANAICYKNCIYRMFHYNQIAGDSVKVSSEASVNYYPHRCIMQRYERLGNLLRLSWIRPEDLRFYTAIGIHYFKLQGRHTVVNGDPVRAAESYMKGHCEGDLMELLDMFDPTSSFRVFIENKKLDGFIKPFYENPGFCKNDCAQCGYCDNYARKAIDNKKSEEVMKKADIFYNQYDQFKNKLESLKNMKNNNGESDDFRDVEFALD